MLAPAFASTFLSRSALSTAVVLLTVGIGTGVPSTIVTVCAASVSRSCVAFNVVPSYNCWQTIRLVPTAIADASNVTVVSTFIVAPVATKFVVPPAVMTTSVLSAFFKVVLSV